MTSINNLTKTISMPQNCGMKGMHENHGSHSAHANHTSKNEISKTQQTSQVELVKSEGIGNKLDARV